MATGTATRPLSVDETDVWLLGTFAAQVEHTAMLLRGRLETGKAHPAAQDIIRRVVKLLSVAEEDLLSIYNAAHDDQP